MLYRTSTNDYRKRKREPWQSDIGIGIELEPLGHRLAIWVVSGLRYAMLKLYSN